MNAVEEVRVRIETTKESAKLLTMGEPGVPRAWKRRRRPVRGALYAFGFFLAAVGAAVGLFLAATPPPVTVSLTTTSYRIDSTVLHEVAPGQFAGAGAVVILPAQAGVRRAAGSATVHGVTETGVCLVTAAQSEERCRFAIGGNTVSAVDTWNGHGWARRYDDGRSVSITAEDMIPVPFAVGR